jgi:DNA-binding MarR family transcriptional regulator
MKDEKTYEEISTDLIQLISEFHKVISPIFKKDLNDNYGLNKNQVRVMMIIGRSNEITPTVLGRCMDMEKGSLTTLIGSLEELKLVYRKDDPKDKRKVLLYLTSKGKEYFYEQEEKFKKKIEEIFSSLSEKEFVSFKESLDTIIFLLNKVRED